ncbi:MAG: T9SS type A sorting domain-containing protein [Salinivirgaceae bacterium]|nr:T9SS type A sorting domain-containing protein [Salinivirgaceae bacterium]
MTIQNTAAQSGDVEFSVQGISPDVLFNGTNVIVNTEATRTGDISVSNMSLRLYISEDTEKDASDVLLKEVFLADNWDESNTQTVLLNATIPESQIAGDYYLLLVFDETNQLTQEDDETNNLWYTAITVENCGAFTIDFSPSHSTCGLPNGSVLANVSGGASPYTYDWSNGAIGNFIENLPSGYYVLEVTDNYGCTGTGNVTIEESQPLQVSVETADDACGSYSGSANLTVTGGQTPYNAIWSNGSEGLYNDNLSAGQYSATITDYSGCQTTVDVTIESGSQLTATINTQNASCGNVNGSATVQPSGGQSPYSYFWSNGASTQQISNIEVGSYAVTVTDDNGCTFITNANVEDSNPLELSFEKSNENCSQSDGSISVSVQNGVSPYTYTWSNEANGSEISNISAGIYSVTVIDNSGCSISQQVTITNTAGPTITLETTETSCVDNTGQIAALVNDGTSPYSYSWSTGGDTDIITGLGVGSYSVTVSDLNGCSVSETATVAYTKSGGTTGTAPETLDDSLIAYFPLTINSIEEVNNTLMIEQGLIAYNNGAEFNGNNFITAQDSTALNNQDVVSIALSFEKENVVLRNYYNINFWLNQNVVPVFTGISGTLIYTNTWWDDHGLKIDMNQTGTWDYILPDTYQSSDFSIQADRYWGEEFSNGFKLQDYNAWCANFKSGAFCNGSLCSHNPYGVRAIWKSDTFHDFSFSGDYGIYGSTFYSINYVRQEATLVEKYGVYSLKLTQDSIVAYLRDRKVASLPIQDTINNLVFSFDFNNQNVFFRNNSDSVSATFEYQLLANDYMPFTIGEGLVGSMKSLRVYNRLLNTEEKNFLISGASNGTTNFDLVLDLGADYSVCSNETVEIDAGNGFASYTWSTGYTGRVLNLMSLQNGNNIFSVQTEACGQEFADTVQIYAAESKFTEMEIDICHGSYYDFNGNVLDQSGVFMDTLNTVFGCDSIVTLYLTIMPESIENRSMSICSGDSIVIKDSVFYESGTHLVGFTDQYGCDSTIVLDLTVNPSYNENVSASICEGESYVVGDSMYLETGSYTTVLENQFGCDSTVILDLTVNPAYTNNLSAGICQGESYIIGENTFTESGSYSVTLESEYGCDSVVNLQLTVNSADYNEISADVCEGDSYTVGNSTYTETGVYTDVLENQFGCDSTVVLDLTVNSGYEIDLNETICDGQSITIGDETFYETGYYTVPFTTLQGCDSVINLILIVNPSPFVNLGPDTVITTEATLLLDAGSGYESYQWNTTETTQSIEIGDNYGVGTHNFFVDVLNNYGCEDGDTIAVTIILPDGIQQQNKTQVKLYPNPTKGHLTVEFEQLLPNTEISIFNQQGKIVESKQITDVSKLLYEFDLHDMSEGVYLIQVNSSGYKFTKRIILIR